jgi:hypothetical protein
VELITKEEQARKKGDGGRIRFRKIRGTGKETRERTEM